MLHEELNNREKSILRYIIQQFILTAAPVGSKNITEKYEIGLSSASVRNIMSELEEHGLIDHPHTSAGRIPTDKGYRFYVDSLMEINDLKSSEKSNINKVLESHLNETDELINITSKLLSSITKQVACVMYPSLDSGILEKIQLINLSSTRLLIVISIRSGLVKTITLEVNSELKGPQLREVQSLLNERLSGLTLLKIRTTLRERFKDVSVNDKPILTMFVDSADKIFTDFKTSEKIVVAGAKNLLNQPEFENTEKFQSIIELIEDKDIVVHLLEKTSRNKDSIVVTIGSENESEELDDYSLVSKQYYAGDVIGTLGVIGPKRMDYSKIVAIINYISTMLSNYLSKS
jgi:heat-inducible transcriptional repressor